LKPLVDRSKDPFHWGPNLLVTVTSAVEAFARCLVVELLANSKHRLKHAVYEEVKDGDAVELVAMYLSLRGMGSAPKVFGADRWRSFAQAAKKYRQLLLHECTYLNAGKLEELNKASKEVFEKLVELAGYKEHFDRLVAEAAKVYEGVLVKL